MSAEPKLLVEITMRSGQKVRFRCETISTKPNINGGLSMISWDKADNEPLYICLDDVVSVQAFHGVPMKDGI